MPRIEGKPVIGVFGSHDSIGRNLALTRVFDYLYEHHPKVMESYQYAITRGTYRRVIMGETYDHRKWPGVSLEARRFLLEKCGVLRLPCRRHGGVVLLADLVVKRKVSMVWPFLTPTTSHWLTPENLALLRLCDHCRVTRLMNDRSVIEWAKSPEYQLLRHQPEEFPPKFAAGGVNAADDYPIPTHRQKDESYAIDWDAVNRTVDSSKPTLALIAHNDMKSRIEDFVADYQSALKKFYRIIATGTTGKVVQDVAPELGAKIRRYNSGPKGGDIEIATEMIFKRCDVAVFLVDPLSPHPHQEDILVLFGAAILNGARLLTNERQARAWMDATGGSVDRLSPYMDWCEREKGQGRWRVEDASPGVRHP